MRSAEPPPDCILVMADWCSDGPTELAAQAGAVVLAWEESEVRKGAARERGGVRPRRQ